MKTLYLECNMGAAGDMLAAALLELLPDRESFIKKIDGTFSDGLAGVEFSAEGASKCGILGTRVCVKIHGEEEHSHDVHGDIEHHEHHEHHGHHHSGMHEIEHIIGGLNVSEKVKGDVLAVYQLIARAESAVHGRPVDEIHFHEVGTLDAMADITAVCLLMEEIAPEKIIASPVHVGFGEVQCAHGILPVPAPATAHILKGIPVYGGEVRGELCTPTGAALLKYFAEEFGNMPVMSVEKIGCGMGSKDFERANCVRAMLGVMDGERSDEICELKCNLDDMTPEDIGFAVERLLEGGALDVFTLPAGMKKCRPGVLLTCLCSPAKRDDIVRLIFRHTTTLGVRETRCARHILARSEEERETRFGTVRVKTAEGYGVKREKTEFDDRARLAAENNVPISEIK